MFEFMTKFSIEYKNKIEEDAYYQLIKALEIQEKLKDDEEWPF